MGPGCGRAGGPTQAARGSGFLPGKSTSADDQVGLHSAHISAASQGEESVFPMTNCSSRMLTFLAFHTHLSFRNSRESVADEMKYNIPPPLLQRAHPQTTGGGRTRRCLFLARVACVIHAAACVCLPTPDLWPPCRRAPRGPRGGDSLSALPASPRRRWCLIGAGV